MLTLQISRQAEDEALVAYDYYAEKSGAELADRFEAEFLAACDFVAMYPDVGSLRFAHLVRGIDLRTWSLKHFPWRIFYHHDGRTLRVLDVQLEQRDVTSKSLSRIVPKRTH